MCHTLANTHTHTCVCESFLLWALWFTSRSCSLHFSFFCGLWTPSACEFFIHIYFFFLPVLAFVGDKQKPSHPHTPSCTDIFRLHTHTHTHPQLQRPNPFDVAFIALACFFVCRLCRKGSEKDFRVVQTILPHLKLICALTLYDFSGTQMVRQIPKNRFTFLFHFGLLVWVLYPSLGLF